MSLSVSLFLLLVFRFRGEILLLSLGYEETADRLRRKTIERDTAYM